MEWNSTVAGFNFLGGSRRPSGILRRDSGHQRCLHSQANVESASRSPNAEPRRALQGERPSRLRFAARRALATRDADVVYIGKAGGSNQRASLRSRIRSFMQFGRGMPCSHWGGRCIWQLGGMKALGVYWAITHDEEPKAAESRLIDAFCKSQIWDRYGAVTSADQL